MVELGSRGDSDASVGDQLFPCRDGVRTVRRKPDAFNLKLMAELDARRQQFGQLLVGASVGGLESTVAYPERSHDDEREKGHGERNRQLGAHLQVFEHLCLPAGLGRDGLVNPSSIGVRSHFLSACAGRDGRSARAIGHKIARWVLKRRPLASY